MNFAELLNHVQALLRLKVEAKQGPVPDTNLNETPAPVANLDNAMSGNLLKQHPNLASPQFDGAAERNLNSNPNKNEAVTEEVLQKALQNQPSLQPKLSPAPKLEPNK